MTPELEAAMRQYQAAMADMPSPWQAKAMSYSMYAAIIICAIFSILIFWKLWQIERHLRGPQSAPAQRPTPDAARYADADPQRLTINYPTNPSAPLGPKKDDAKYMPRR
jgi:hypothetical protein